MARRSESGAALLSVLLLIALMSVVALGMSEAMLRTLQQARTIDRGGLVSWQVTSVEELGLNGTEALRVETQGALTINTQGLNDRIVVPLGNGVFEGRIVEGSNCLNLNSLAPPQNGSEPDGLAVLAYDTLLETLEFPESQREELVDTLLDWFDADASPRSNGAEDPVYGRLKPPYRTAGGRMANLSELRAVLGYTSDIVDLLRPMICVRPTSDIMRLNLNTLESDQAGLLSVVLSGELSLEEADELLDERPLQGWASVDEFLAEDKVVEVPTTSQNSNLVDIRSSYLVLRALVTNADISQAFEVLYFIEQASPAQLIHRTSGASS